MKIYTKSKENLWKTNETQWKSIQNDSTTYEKPLKSMKINENHIKSIQNDRKTFEKPMKINENQWKSMNIYEIQWNSMKFNENQCKSMKCSGPPESIRVWWGTPCLEWGVGALGGHWPFRLGLLGRRSGRLAMAWKALLAISNGL